MFSGAVRAADAPGTIIQQAPAVVARNTALPDVLNQDAPTISFVAASMNLSGAYSVAAFKRQSDGALPDLPSVRRRPESSAKHIGVFGEFAGLSIDLSCAGSRPVSRVLALSLIRGEAADITADVLCGNELPLTAALLSSFRTAADGSETALMLEISYT